MMNNYDICLDCIGEVAKFLHPEEVNDEVNTGV
jgi:hypothetical protein